MLSSYSVRSVRQTPLCSCNSDVIISTWRRLATTLVVILSLSPSAIPRQLLDKIDHTLSLAHTHNLPTVTPTQVFNHLELAYRYGRLVPNDIPAQDEYDKAFTSYLRCLVDGEDRMREEDDNSQVWTMTSLLQLHSGVWRTDALAMLQSHVHLSFQRKLLKKLWEFNCEQLTIHRESKRRG